jgi:sugar lactone lactonase YvrE
MSVSMAVEKSVRPATSSQECHCTRNALRDTVNNRHSKTSFFLRCIASFRPAAVTLLALSVVPVIAQSTSLTVSGSLPPATVGQSYLVPLQTTGGVFPVTFTEAGSLPGGMFWATSDSSVVLHGAPNSEGSYPLVVTAKDAIGQTSSWTGTLTVARLMRPESTGPVTTVTHSEFNQSVEQDFYTFTIGLSVSPPTVPTGTAGVAYTGVTFTSPGGGNAVDFTESGYLPKGLTATPGTNNLTITGTPVQSGTFTFTINVADHAGHTGSQGYILDIAAAPPVVITASAAVPATLSEGSYFGPIYFSASGGASALTLSESGGLPTGISVQFNSAQLRMFGAPTQTGTFPFTIYATDQAGASVSQSYSFTVTTPPPVSVYPATITSSILVGATYPSTQFYISGGSGSGSVALTSGSLPPGMTFACAIEACPAAIGMLSGTPTKPGTYTFTITATDSVLANASGSRTYTLKVSMPTLTFSPSSFPNGIQTQYYNNAVAITNAPAGYTLSLTGNLPQGLTATSSGTTVTVSGTPGEAGYFPVTITDTDKYGNTEPRGIAITITPAPVLTITSATSPVAPTYKDNVSVTASFSGSYANAVTGALLSYSVDGVSKGFTVLQGTSSTFNLGRLTPASHTLSIAYSGNGFYPATTLTSTFTISLPPYALLGTSRAFNTNASQANAEALDSKGNLYLTSSTFSYSCNCYQPGIVYKVDPQGNLTTFPTTGLLNPNGIAIDGSDNVYISDTKNKRIVEISQAGVQTVLPIVNVLAYPTNLAFDPTYQNLYIMDTQSNGIFEYNFATQATVKLNVPYQASTLAVSPAGTLYIGQPNNYGAGGLYVYDPVAQTTTQLQLAAIDSPSALAFDRAGNLYISNSSLYRLDSTNTVLTTLSGSASSALAVDRHGNIDMLYASTVTQYTPGPVAYGGASTALKASRYNYGGAAMTLYYTSPAGITLTSGATTAATTDFYLSRTSCIATSLCAVYLAEAPQLPGAETGAVTATFSDGTQIVTPLYGTGYQAEVGLSPGNVSQLNPNVNTYGGATTDQNGVVYVTDSSANAVYKIVNGTPSALAFTGLNAPTQLAVDGTGAVYVLDSGTSRIIELDSTGNQSVVFDVNLQGAQTKLKAFALDGGDNLWLSITAPDGIGSIFVFSAYNAYTVFAQGINPPYAMAFDSNGNLDTIDSATGTLTQWSSLGVATSLATGLTATTSMAIEPSGTVYLAGGSNATLTQIAPGSAPVQYSVAGVAVASVVAVDKTGSLTVGDDSTHLLTFNDRTSQTFDFGSVVVGSTSPTQQTTVSNVGNQGGLTFSSLPGDYNFPQDPAATTCNTSNTSLASAAACSLGLYFRPTGTASLSDPGLFRTNIPTQNASSSAFQVPITGNGISTKAVASVSSTALDFGNVAIGTSSAVQTVILTNEGGATLNIASIATGSAVFTDKTTCGTTLASLASCTVSLTYTPSTTGGDQATLTLTDDSSSGTTQTVQLSGTGIRGTTVFLVSAGGSTSSFYIDGVQESANVSGGGIGAAIDATGYMWSIDTGGSSLSKFDKTGVLAGSVSGVGLSGASALAIDGLSQLWVANGNNTVTVLSNTGLPQFTVTDTSISGTSGIAVDISGSVWLVNSTTNTVDEIVGGAAPTAPLAISVESGTPGATARATQAATPGAKP